MKILCIDQILGGSRGLMNNSIFYALKENGYEIDLIGLFEKTDYNTIIRYKKYFENTWFIKVKEHGNNNKIAICKNLIMDLFLPHNGKNELKKIKKTNYDVIISFMPSVRIYKITKQIKKIIPEVKYIQFYSDSITMSMCGSKNDIKKKRMIDKYIENKMLNIADDIVYYSPLLCDLAKQVFPAYSDKMRWVDIVYYDVKIEEKSNNDVIKVGYFGSFESSIRNIKPFLEAIKSFSNEQFIVRGETDIDVSEYQYSNLDIIQGRQDYDKISKLENQCDILISIGNIKGNQIPGKTYYYMMLHKPIIYIGDGSCNDAIVKYIKEMNRFIICENNSVSIGQAINIAIKQMNNFSYNIPQRMTAKNVGKKIIYGRDAKE
jgi:hypothetical protein